MYKLLAELKSDPYNNEHKIIVVGEMHSIFNLWFILNNMKKYKLEVIDLSNDMVINPKNGIPLCP